MFMDQSVGVGSSYVDFEEMVYEHPSDSVPET
jgi:hypothetical protein